MILPTEFAVRSEDFTLYEKFKADLEKLGWVYNEKFRAFNKHSMQNNKDIYISKNWSQVGDFLFSLSNATGGQIYHLDTEYSEALKHATELIKNRKDIDIDLLSHFMDYVILHQDNLPLHGGHEQFIDNYIKTL